MTDLRLPQPHEGITGTDRDDDLLSLDERAVVHRDALIVMARHLRTATLVGQPAPVVRRMSERLDHPEPGDLVVTAEVMYGHRDLDTRIKGLGIYLAGREEWDSTDVQRAAWCEEERTAGGDPEAEGRLADRAFYIQYGPAAGDVCRWTNSRVVVLPVQIGDFSAPAGIRDGSATVFTRDSLIGGLADSGFELRRPEKAGPDG
jgi:hypothetical protein